MKAIVYTKYGPPEVLQLKEVAKPTPREDEVLIKVQAVSVNRSDWTRTHSARPKRGLASCCNASVVDKAGGWR
jgi:NADPH:quinone reductase-like Zn-dependent oxidoreductase